MGSRARAVRATISSPEASAAEVMLVDKKAKTPKKPKQSKAKGAPAK